MAFEFEGGAWPPLEPTQNTEIIVQRVRARYRAAYPDKDMRFAWSVSDPSRLDVIVTKADGSETRHVVGRSRPA